MSRRQTIFFLNRKLPMKNVQVIASAMPTATLAAEGVRRLTGNGGIDLNDLTIATRHALLIAQAAYADAVRAAQAELVNNEIKILIRELGLAA